MTSTENPSTCTLPPHLKGTAGERHAKAYLENRGYKVIEENYRCKMGEIDLVCKKNKTIHIVEVKSGVYSQDFDPLDHFDWKKQLKVQRVAKHYIWSKNLYHINIQFDLLTVIFISKMNPEIKFYENAIPSPDKKIWEVF